jgi:hypothetical protein
MAKKPLTLVGAEPRRDVASAPAGLGPVGVATWNQVLAEYSIPDIGGRLVLEQIAAATDTLARLREEISKGELTVELKAGRRANPLLREALGYHAFIVSGLKRLGVLDEPIQQHGGPYKRYGV